ncbi:Uncharacterised protein [uncultured archaeon]|nr:Uncharacterised protein [uncultured archaeon]
MKKLEEYLRGNWGLVLVLATLLVFVVLKALLAGKQGDWLNVVFGALIVVEIAYLVFTEVREGVHKNGWSHEIVDTLLAIGIALAVWFGAQWVLGTSTPVSAVVSCSMLDNLQRGDFVVVQGGAVTAMTAQLSDIEYYQLVHGPFVVTDASGSGRSLNMPLGNYCQCNFGEDFCTQFLKNPTAYVETAGAATFHYKKCGKNYATGKQSTAVCLDYFDIKGQRFRMGNTSNDIIVYTPRPGELYYYMLGGGDIVHRTAAKLNVSGKMYYLTGGDNNPMLDSQYYDCSSGVGNAPPSTDNTKGHVIGRVPYLGYLRLFIAGYWGEDEQCGWVLKR